MRACTSPVKPHVSVKNEESSLGGGLGPYALGRGMRELCGVSVSLSARNADIGIRIVTSVAGYLQLVVTARYICNGE